MRRALVLLPLVPAVLAAAPARGADSVVPDEFATIEGSARRLLRNATFSAP